MAQRWLLPPEWFDYCWEIGRFDEKPFPLAVRSHGATLEERAVRRQQAVPHMNAAGVLTGEQLTPAFGDVLARIAKPGLWIEGICFPDENTTSPLRILSLAHENGAVLVVQSPGETDTLGGDLQISLLSEPFTAAAVQAMPPAPPGKRPRLAVPRSALAPPKTHGDEDFSEMDLMGSDSGRGNPAERTATAVREILETAHFRDGQFTANLRDRNGKYQRSPVFTWFDLADPDGRYGLSDQLRPGNEPEIVVAPIGPGDIRSALDNRVAQIRNI